MSANKDRKPEPGQEPQMGQDSKDLKDPQKQQQQGVGQQQQQSGTGQQYGEGSYSGTRQYNKGLKEHVENHDIEREARWKASPSLILCFSSLCWTAVRKTSASS